LSEQTRSVGGWPVLEPNGPLMARRLIHAAKRQRPSFRRLLPTWAFTLERMTGIDPALSAWELACHARSDHEFAGQWHSGPCPLLTGLRRRSPTDRARSGPTPVRLRAHSNNRLQGRLGSSACCPFPGVCERGLSSPGFRLMPVGSAWFWHANGTPASRMNYRRTCRFRHRLPCTQAAQSIGVNMHQ
jgi:hypothetical protein